MVTRVDCFELQRRLREFEDELHTVQDEMRQANNRQIVLDTDLREDRRNLRALQAAETAWNGLPVERTPLRIVQALGAASLSDAISDLQAIVDRKEEELGQIIRTQDLGRQKAGQLQHNIDRTMSAMRANGC